MILINKVEVTADELQDLFPMLRIKKLLKRPEFEINPARQSAKRFIGTTEVELLSPVGTRFPAHFFAKDNIKGSKTAGKTLEIRYAESMAQEPATPGSDRIIDKYYPQKVMFSGVNMLFQQHDADLILYFFLHPLNEHSPFRESIVEPFHYSFNDVELKGEKVVEKTKTLQKALNTIYGLSGEPLKVLARGLGISGVSEMGNDVQIQAALTPIAMKDPEKFITASQSQRTVFQGLIVSAVEMGVFRVDVQNGVKRWIWGKGENQGTQVVEVLNNGKTEMEFLTNHCIDNFNSYYSVLLTMHTMAAKEQKINNQFDSMGTVDINNLFGGSTDDVSATSAPVQNQIEEAKEIVTQAAAQAGADLPEPMKEELTSLIPPVASEVIDEEDDLPDFLKGRAIPAAGPIGKAKPVAKKVAGKK